MSRTLVASSTSLSLSASPTKYRRATIHVSSHAHTTILSSPTRRLPLQNRSPKRSSLSMSPRRRHRRTSDPFSKSSEGVTLGWERGQRMLEWAWSYLTYILAMTTEHTLTLSRHRSLLARTRFSCTRTLPNTARPRLKATSPQPSTPPLPSSFRRRHTKNQATRSRSSCMEFLFAYNPTLRLNRIGEAPQHVCVTGRTPSKKSFATSFMLPWRYAQVQVPQPYFDSKEPYERRDAPSRNAQSRNASHAPERSPWLHQMCTQTHENASSMLGGDHDLQSALGRSCE